MKERILRAQTLLYLFVALAVLCFSPQQLISEPRDTFSMPKRQQIIAQGEVQTPTANGKKQVDKSASQDLQEDLLSFKRPSLLTQAIVLTLLSLSPFIVMILTSFLKIVIVLSLLRNALGVQQAPPNQIINGVAFMLSLFIMYPTGLKMYQASEETIKTVRAPESLISPESSQYITEIAGESIGPMRDFLQKNSLAKHHALFYRIAYRVLPDEFRATLTPDDFIILVPAYITSQLKAAFEIGVLIYIPFFVIDLVTSNILLAMGMMMLSPVTISMPIKLFLLVMLDGWTLLIDGLVNTFYT